MYSFCFSHQQLQTIFCCVSNPETEEKGGKVLLMVSKIIVGASLPKNELVCLNTLGFQDFLVVDFLFLQTEA